MRSVDGAMLKRAVADLFAGQHTAANSIWLIETYPEAYEYDTLHTVVYFLTMPVPRVLWENKPNALGRTMVQQGFITQVGRNFSMGPGIIGHCATDNPWIALPLYALSLGLLLRLIDERVKRNVTSPFIVLPAGAALAQVLGLGRGETGLFLFNAATAMIGSWAVLAVSGKLLASAGWLHQYLPEPEACDQWSEEYADEPAAAGTG